MDEGFEASCSCAEWLKHPEWIPKNWPVPCLLGFPLNNWGPGFCHFAIWLCCTRAWEPRKHALNTAHTGVLAIPAAQGTWPPRKLPGTTSVNSCCGQRCADPCCPLWECPVGRVYIAPTPGSTKLWAVLAPPCNPTNSTSTEGVFGEHPLTGGRFMKPEI